MLPCRPQARGCTGALDRLRPVGVMASTRLQLNSPRLQILAVSESLYGPRAIRVELSTNGREEQLEPQVRA